jgi:hypothetical protein
MRSERARLQQTRCTETFWTEEMQSELENRNNGLELSSCGMMGDLEEVREVKQFESEVGLQQMRRLDV